jgi:molybdate transport system ATP-binding protein
VANFSSTLFAKRFWLERDNVTGIPKGIGPVVTERQEYMESQRLLIRLSNISVTRDKKTILSNINWDLKIGENWAVIGSNGAGKTTFLNLVRGDIWPTPGSGTRFYYTNGKSHTSPMGFRGKTGIVSPELLDRYKKNNWNLKVSDVICTGFWDTAFLYQIPDEDQSQRALETMIFLKIEDLADTRFLDLSLGQAKKVLLARAIVQNPQLLVLDELCAGLDEDSRRDVAAVVQSLAEQGTHILCSSHTRDDLVPAITHVLELDDGRIKALGEKTRMLGENHKDRPIPHEADHSVSFPQSPEFLLRVVNADVFIQGRKVISNMNWDIMSGEHWGVCGANASGKTTLLNLISGDLHPAWGGSVQRLRKISSRNLWDIRCKISMVSADIQAWHQDAQTGIEVLLSGFRGTIGLHHPVTSDQEFTAHQWLASHRLAHLADRDVRTLSYGQLRMLLILRAMIVQPRMLLLDEPLSGLDLRHRGKVLDLIEELASDATTLIYVTHSLDEMPRAISHLLELKDGAIRYCGPKSDHSSIIRMRI